jgi:hypothetical protein
MLKLSPQTEKGPYEAPSAQVIELSLEGVIAVSGGTEPFTEGFDYGEDLFFAEDLFIGLF